MKKEQEMHEKYLSMIYKCSYQILAAATIAFNTSAISVTEGTNTNVCVELKPVNNTSEVGCDLTISLSAMEGKAGVNVILLLCL